MKSKIITIILLIFITSLLFFGCNKNNAPENFSSDIISTVSETTPVPPVTADPNFSRVSNEPTPSIPYDVPVRESWNIEMTISNIRYFEIEQGSGIKFDLRIIDHDNLGFEIIDYAIGIDYYNGDEWVEFISYRIPPNELKAFIPPRPEGKGDAQYYLPTSLLRWDERLPDGKYRYCVKLYDKVSEKMFYAEFDIVKEDILKEYNEGK